MKKITINLSYKTLARIEEIRELTGETNKARIISLGMEIVHLMLNEAKNGSQIKIEKKDGSCEAIYFKGL